MKIIVIGAGIGGLQAAKCLADGGNEVTVYEKNNRENLSYDWIDDVEAKVFTHLGIPLTKECFRTAEPTFAVPFSKLELHVEVPENTRDWSIERREFSNILADLAVKAGATVQFDTAVDALLIEGGKVCGVIIGGRKILADLVIDSSGASSPFRASLPENYNIQACYKPHEIFRAYRAFYAPADNLDYTKANPKKIYLKHLGEAGISWCFVEPNGDANVLIGRIGELSDETLRHALCDLKKENPVIGDKLLRGDFISTIPVRYPLTRMVGDGYAAIGDAAFMTIPMIGSGIANSLRAGKMLADAVQSSNSADVKSLWKYQYQYYREIGAAHFTVDKIKRMLLNADGDDIRFLFDSGVIGEREMSSIGNGEKLTMSPAQILDKIKRGWTRIGLLLSLVKAITGGEKAEKLAQEIPAEFDETAVTRWQNALDKMFD